MARIPADDHVRREPYLKEIEAQWGPAPGRQNSDGANIQILGERFGNIAIAVQPGFGYEGDPMRLLFEKGFAPTHAFSAFYRWIREDFGAHAVLHFGTHGALEFMPGKQSGLSGDCWPDRLIGNLPNLYLYAANNPSEGAIAKRRSQATLISYLTPPVAQAGLYRGLVDLKGSIEFHVGDMLNPALGAFDHVVAMDSLIHYQPADIANTVAALLPRTRGSMVITFAPKTALLTAMHTVGKLFPRGDRAPAIVPVTAMTLCRLLKDRPEATGWNYGQTQLVTSGFYKSQAFELKRG